MHDSVNCSYSLYRRRSKSHVATVVHVTGNVACLKVYTDCTCDSVGREQQIKCITVTVQC